MNSTNTTDTIPNFKDPLNLGASFLMFLNGIFGIVCNSSIIYIFAINPNDRTSFNLICVFRAAMNIFILSWAFLGTFLPTTLTGASPFSPYYESSVILICNTVYTVIQYSALVIAMNRMCAMFFPFIYSKFFSVKLTFAALFLVLVYTLVGIFLYIPKYVGPGCFVGYSSYYLSWVPNMDESCYDKIASPVNGTAIFLTLLFISNVATFTKIYFFWKSTVLEEHEMRKKIKRNRVLFMQTVFQDAIIFVDMLFTFKLSSLSSSRIWSFLCGSFIWQSVHSSDGLIMVMFNERLTFLKKSLFPQSDSPSIANQSVFVPAVSQSRV